ncbi:universal stress protein [Desulfopila sp. IMCC35006]|uniref:universal stress protein n=1 Tax=Desulfopila sp. IMCC35006 TaxID=2569542 RepID=UPI0010AC7B00|nr:universal stress protein [Desulfopila sp. IMCC35006]TKB25204.1 universal stress protein [Desulfopila sp. IMCC35006]
MLPKIETILYATGLGPGAPYIFRYALALARQHKAKIVAVHGMEPLTTFGQSLVEQYISHESSEQMHSKAREVVKMQLKERIEKLCNTECNHKPPCDNPVSAIHVVDGYPDQVIVNLAKEVSADLIVMGAQSHGKVSEIVMGSTTRKVLHNATQPVLVVRVPKGFTEEIK